MYALPKASALPAGADRAKIDAAVKTAVAYGTFTGTYARKG
jgi:hypothetical protein